MSSPAGIIQEFALRAGTYLFVMFWLLLSAWWLSKPFKETVQNWGSWDTYPIPSKRAAMHVFWMMLLVAGDFLILWLTLAWFTHPLP